MKNFWIVVLTTIALNAFALSPCAVAQDDSPPAGVAAESAFLPPVRLEADGEVIDIGKLSGFGHAGPEFGDVDGDGDRDLVVGDFPGYFWLFENTANDEAPIYTAKGKLQAGGGDAKTPVY